ncbi:MAG: hypothetical protein ABIH41_00370 [Nanoarchaeota archaeon]
MQRLSRQRIDHADVYQLEQIVREYAVQQKYTDDLESYDLDPGKMRIHFWESSTLSNLNRLSINAALNQKGSLWHREELLYRFMDLWNGPYDSTIKTKVFGDADFDKKVQVYTFVDDASRREGQLRAWFGPPNYISRNHVDSAGRNLLLSVRGERSSVLGIMCGLTLGIKEPEDCVISNRFAWRGPALYFPDDARDLMEGVRVT